MMNFDVLILNIVLILSKKSFLKDLNCYEYYLRQNSGTRRIITV